MKAKAVRDLVAEWIVSALGFIGTMVLTAILVVVGLLLPGRWLERAVGLWRGEE